MQLAIQKKNRKNWKTQKPTRRERLNKRKGKMGAGWKKNNHSPSQHIFSKERWVVAVVGSDQQPRAFLSEKRANEIATAIANKHNLSVEIDHQVMVGHEEGGFIWKSAPEEES